MCALCGLAFKETPPGFHSVKKGSYASPHNFALISATVGSGENSQTSRKQNICTAPTAIISLRATPVVLLPHCGTEDPNASQALAAR